MIHRIILYTALYLFVVVSACDRKNEELIINEPEFPPVQVDTINELTIGANTLLIDNVKAKAIFKPDEDYIDIYQLDLKLANVSLDATHFYFIFGPDEGVQEMRLQEGSYNGIVLLGIKNYKVAEFAEWYANGEIGPQPTIETEDLLSFNAEQVQVDVLAINEQTQELALKLTGYLQEDEDGSIHPMAATFVCPISYE